MFCQQCGTANADNATSCSKCGMVFPPAAQPAMAGYPGGYAPVPSVPNYLVWAILSTLFCCLPLGIVSIVYAAQVNGQVASGNVAGAMESSRKAKLFAWLAFGLGLGVQVLWLLITIVGAAASA